jgi:hypothetical protein
VNGPEVVGLLGFVRAFCPAQKMDDYTPDAWLLALRDLSLDDCKAAVVEIAKREPWIAPADVRKEVRRAREDRLSRVPEIAVPDADPDDVAAYQRALREDRYRVAEGLKPRPVAALVAGLTRVYEAGDDPRAIEARESLHQSLKGTATHDDEQVDATDDRGAG